MIEGRYPGDWEPITMAEAQLALEMAQAVRQAVLKQLPLGRGQAPGAPEPRNE